MADLDEVAHCTCGSSRSILFAAGSFTVFSRFKDWEDI